MDINYAVTHCKPVLEVRKKLSFHIVPVKRSHAVCESVTAVWFLRKSNEFRTSEREFMHEVLCQSIWWHAPPKLHKNNNPCWRVGPNDTCWARQEQTIDVVWASGTNVEALRGDKHVSRMHSAFARSWSNQVVISLQNWFWPLVIARYMHAVKHKNISWFFHLFSFLFHFWIPACSTSCLHNAWSTFEFCCFLATKLNFSETFSLKFSSQETN